MFFFTFLAPGKHFNLIILIPCLEYTGISSKVLKIWNMSPFLTLFFYLFYICDAAILLLIHNHCDVCVIILLIIIHSFCSEYELNVVPKVATINN